MQAFNRRVEDLQEHPITVPEPPRHLSWPDLQVRAGRPVLTGSRLSVEGRLPGPVDVAVSGGGRLLLTGPNGAGKSNLLGVLAGEVNPTSGNLLVHHGARAVLLSQEVPDWNSQHTAHQACQAHVEHLQTQGVTDRPPSLSGLSLLDTVSLRTPVKRMS